MTTFLQTLGHSVLVPPALHAHSNVPPCTSNHHSTNLTSRNIKKRRYQAARMLSLYPHHKDAEIRLAGMIEEPGYVPRCRSVDNCSPD